ncbi:hypothetical protein F4780DRAFT_75757 [Xylariomycetidae sp. FL0641]|nr:hypothetical protein F4780DRAFT_75757 [Xylariomycetidae sp. FL0641]
MRTGYNLSRQPCPEAVWSQESFHRTMEWLLSDGPSWGRNLDLFRFRQLQSTVLSLSQQSELMVEKTTLSNDQQWQEWLDQGTPETGTAISSKMNLIIGGRAESQFPNPGLVSYLPFSKTIFQQVTSRFHLHASIARVINRNTNCTFSRRLCSWEVFGNRSLVYNCRSAAPLSDDLALSVTYFPDTSTTYAMFYGCNEDITSYITKHLSKLEAREFHPMILPAVFAELERNRQVKSVREKISLLTQRIVDVGTEAMQEESRDKTTIIRWLGVNHLRNGLQSFLQYLRAMVSHTDELHATLFRTGSAEAASLDAEQIRELQVAGTRIKERLQEIILEYEENIRDCSTFIEGLNIATQMEWNQIGRQDARTNKEIAELTLNVAERTRRDSERMKSIAVLTMIFLPATFVATIFSMGIFDWKGEGGRMMTVSPYIWVYVVATVLVTSITLGVWYYRCQWNLRRDGKEDLEKQSIVS